MSSRREGGGRGKEVGIYASPTLPHSPDCDLHCKPARGSYRISLKKFCRKDYGRQPSSLLPLTFSPCTPHFPFGYPNPCWPQGIHCPSGPPLPLAPPGGSLWWPVLLLRVSSLCLPRAGGCPVSFLPSFPPCHECCLPLHGPLPPGLTLPPPPRPSLPPAAVQVAVGARGEARGSWTRFPVAVLAVFRSGEERARRGSSALWVPTRDAACGCPRLLPGRRYLLLGGKPGTSVGGSGSRGPGLSAARGSLVLPWRDAWTRRLRRLQRRERRGRCQAA